jgi:hypothetical protein
VTPGRRVARARLVRGNDWALLVCKPSHPKRIGTFHMIDHDRLFKELLKTFFLDFLDLFAPEMAALIDRDSV